ncbi:MAG: preprotein translocase subunit SecE [Candidatus Saccharibacteria bacterium]|nr:preprotein translocase subunit SecE [Candidatus Saccharibacteria bacterium]
MAKITRIKASDSAPKKPKESPKPTSPKAKTNPKKSTAAKPTKAPSKSPKKALPKWLAIITWPFRTLGKPFVALGRYIKASWQEIRQVRWPSRKATWKMTGAILIYAALILAIILLLDALFTFIFNNILGS